MPVLAPVVLLLLPRRGGFSQPRKLLSIEPETEEEPDPVPAPGVVFAIPACIP